MGIKQGTANAVQIDFPVNSAALKRLAEEVAAGTASMIRGYNRTHNRHNR